MQGIGSDWTAGRVGIQADAPGITGSMSTTEKLFGSLEHNGLTELKNEDGTRRYLES